MLLIQHYSIAFKRSLYQFTLLKQQQRRGMKAYIQIVGQHTPEGPPSVILHYDSQRYIFNVREGTQRLCVQEKVRLGKANHIFLSRTSWDCVGGLTGLLLTLTDAGVKKIHLHGGKNLSHFIAATRRFAYRTSSTLEVNEFDEKKEFSDKNLSVKPVIALPQLPGQKRPFEKVDEEEEEVTVEKETGSDSKRLVGKEADNYRQQVIASMFSDKSNNNKSATAIDANCTPRHPLRNNKKGGNDNQINYLRQPLPYTRPYPAAISYICQGATLPRKFNKDAALALGVRPGPLYGQLHKGQSVTLEDGRVVTQDMVCDPPKPGHVFMLIDCPSVAYIDQLIGSEKFKEFQTGGKQQANVILHFLGNDVIHDERYKQWVASFGENTDHVFSSQELCRQDVQFTSHALCQVKLSKLDETIFPVPKYSVTPELNISDIDGLPTKSFALDSMATYNLEPKRNLEYLNRPIFDHTNRELPEIKAIENNKEYNDAADLARLEASKVDISQAFPGHDVEVITLGTGSSIPAKYRNVSATLVKIPDYGSIMLDAGEGTYGQMIRRFGIESLEREMRSLGCIFVSHLHADHHLGVIQLIRKWYEANGDKTSCLTVIAPRVFRDWLNEYCQVEFVGNRRRLKFISNENLLTHRQAYPDEMTALNNVKKRLGFSLVRPIEVIHCRWAYGLSIEHENGWKLVYSGDTRPCDNLIKEGQNATLLIHEATFDDTEKENAEEKRHTTTGEAIEVGQRMNARYTLLNHFSQRYPKIPNLSEEQSNVCFSFDLMSTLIKQIPILPKFTNAMQLIFKESEEPEDEQNMTTEEKMIRSESTSGDNTINQSNQSRLYKVNYEEDPSGYLKIKIESLLYWEYPMKTVFIFFVTLSLLLFTQHYSLLRIFAGLFTVITGVNWIYVNLHKQIQRVLSSSPYHPYHDRFNQSLFDRERVVRGTERWMDVAETVARYVAKLILIENSYRSMLSLLSSFTIWTLTKYVSTQHLLMTGLILAFSLPRIYSQHQQVIDAHVEEYLKRVHVLLEKYGSIVHQEVNQVGYQIKKLVVKQKSQKTMKRD
ncbi:hypothetical protein G6F43_004892 [Rhizopus delemar]|nr:hypothetical protein G6F43_004892 [Rhizopus delemar]